MSDRLTLDQSALVTKIYSFRPEAASLITFADRYIDSNAKAMRECSTARQYWPVFRALDVSLPVPNLNRFNCADLSDVMNNDIRASPIEGMALFISLTKD